MTLLGQLDAAETRLIAAEQQLKTARAIAQSSGRINSSFTRAAEVDVMAAAAHAQITAARCLTTTEDISDDQPIDPFERTMPAPALANAPAPRDRDHGMPDDVDQALAPLNAFSEFLTDPLRVADRYGALMPLATCGSPIASHGIEDGRFGVIHWHAPIPALRLDLKDPR